jgi:hypothetical protein
MRCVRTLKYIVRRVLPDRLLVAVKKVYYPYLLPSVTGLGSEVISCLVTPGMQVIDIGASIGLYTKLMSELLTFTKVG